MKLGWLIPLALVLTACGGGDGSPKDDAGAATKRLEAGVTSVDKTVTITEDNDPNDKIGRDGGYVAGAVLYDSRTSCDSLGVECGATIEEWPDADSAQERLDYIKSLGAIANEYGYRDGSLVLRVTGELKPSQAAEYEAAFAG